MSPPIYTPDGSEVSEIVLPDGSTASELIGPDGNVVFEAGPDIPDSVVNNMDYVYLLNEGTANTLNDAVDNPSQNLTISGPDWVTGTSNGYDNTYLDFVAANSDRVTDGVTSTWDNTTFTWAGWINPDTTSGGNQIVACGLNQSSEWYTISIGGFPATSGELAFGMSNGDSGSNFSIGTPNVTSNSWQFFGARADFGNTTAEFYYADVGDSDLSIVGSNNYDNQTQPGNELQFGARWSGTEPTEEYDGQMSIMMSNVGAAVSQTTLEQIFDDTKQFYRD